MIQKSEVRQILLERRKQISSARREEAARNAFENLKGLGRVLSFSPMGTEIDLTLLNQFLQDKGHLSLVPYTIDDLCHVSLSDIDCILVPGVGFDASHMRIGYGKGFYDRLLATTKDLLTIGVGFKEQFYEGLLPKDPWDIPLKEIRLF